VIINRKRVVIFALVLTFVILAIVGIALAIVFTREGVTVSSGTFSRWSTQVSGTAWTVSAGRANGNARMDRTFTAEELANLRVLGGAEGGVARLVVIHGDYRLSMYARTRRGVLPKM